MSLSHVDIGRSLMLCRSKSFSQMGLQYLQNYTNSIHKTSNHYIKLDNIALIMFVMVAATSKIP